MRAMILAAGVGSRLGALTSTTPKCLVPLGDGTCMLDRVVAHLHREGVTDVIINLFHYGDAIVDHVDKAQYPLRCEFSRESTLLGTGGGIRHARGFLEQAESFFVYNSDIYYEGPLRPLREVMKPAHSNKDPLAALGVMRRDTSRSLLFNEKLLLIGWENDGVSRYAGSSGDESAIVRYGFSGIHCVNSRIFRYMEPFPQVFSIIEVYMKAVESGEAVEGVEVGAHFWLDMGTPERLETLRAHVRGHV